MAINRGERLKVSSDVDAPCAVRIAGTTCILNSVEVASLSIGIEVTSGRLLGVQLQVGADGDGIDIDGAYSVVAGSRISTGGHGVIVRGDDCVIEDNSIPVAGVATTDTFDGIHMSGDRNLAAGNHITSTGDARSAVNAQGVDDIYYGNVAIGTFGTAEYIDGGTGTQNTMPGGAGAQGDNFII